MRRTSLAIMGILFLVASVACSQPNLREGGYMGCHYPKSLLQQPPESGIVGVQAAGTVLLGVDVSTYQGTINWTSLKSVKSFAVIRSSYGTGYTDNQFHNNQPGARNVGILHGFYHYAYPQYNAATDEADWFVSVVGALQTGEVLVLDFEESYSNPPAWCKAFLDRVYSRTGIKPWIYLNYSQTNSYNWSSVISAGYPLWLADWDNNTNPATPTTVWGFNACKQYSSKGTGVAGISSTYVDLDAFNGDSTKWISYGSGPLPTITQQPVSQTTCQGIGVTFTIAATCPSGTLSYQWQLNGSDIAGATSTSYTTSVAGSYDCVVTGLWGSVTSNTATLTVNPLPVITTQPVTPQRVAFGDTATFSIAASGTSLSYQWKRYGVAIPGATSTSYTTDDPGAYTCTVTGGCGSVTSNTGTLLINNATYAASVAAAKQLPDQTVVAIAQAPNVVRSFDGFYYLEDFNRVAGIKVVPNGAENMLAEGSVALIYGILQTVGGERVVNNALINTQGLGLQPGPMMMTCKSAAQPLAQGLLVRVPGTVSLALGASDMFTLGDGSANINVKLYGVALPEDGSQVTVQGVVGVDSGGPCIRVNDSSDIW